MPWRYPNDLNSDGVARLAAWGRPTFRGRQADIRLGKEGWKADFGARTEEPRATAIRFPRLSTVPMYSTLPAASRRAPTLC